MGRGMSNMVLLRLIFGRISQALHGWLADCIVSREFSYYQFFLYDQRVYMNSTMNTLVQKVHFVAFAEHGRTV